MLYTYTLVKKESEKMQQTITGKFNSATVFTDILEDKAAEQIKELCNQVYSAGSKIRIMPDVHAGAGCTIGTTMTIKDKIVPNLVGVDIGCGMECIQIKQRDIDLDKLDAVIHVNIPAGFNIRKNAHTYAVDTRIDQLICQVNRDRAIHSLGTLGGGNHFIEANRDDDGNIYIVVHSGSRHMGLEIANYYQDLAWKNIIEKAKPDITGLIVQLKLAGRYDEIESAVKDLKSRTQSTIPKSLAYVDGALFNDYIHDMQIAQEYATLNRKAILNLIVDCMGFKVCDQFTTIHNYIDMKSMILRKGAVSAKLGERLLIPINMRDGSLICVGKGNDEWNQSAPHGAGRLMSRTAAKQEFTLIEFQEQMQGVYSSTVDISTLDECPMAYKSMDDIVRNISNTAEIIKIIKPIYNFKAN